MTLLQGIGLAVLAAWAGLIVWGALSMRNEGRRLRRERRRRGATSRHGTGGCYLGPAPDPMPGADAHFAPHEADWHG